MTNSTKAKKNENENIIGILFTVPFYMIIYVILNYLHIVNYDFYKVFHFVIYLPILLGLFMSYSSANKNSTWFLSLLIFIVLGYSFYDYYNMYLVGSFSFNGLVIESDWFKCLVAVRMLSCVLYAKNFSDDKAITFLKVYIFIFAALYILGV